MDTTTDAKHIAYMEQALSYAKQSVAVNTAYNVGCVIVDPTTDEVVSYGFSRELPGNTHAEECALHKLLPNTAKGFDLYSTMEPCSKRLSGKVSCSERIIANQVKRVFIGALEPANFVDCEGVKLLQEANIEVFFVQAEGLKERCLRVNQHVLSKGKSS